MSSLELMQTTEYTPLPPSLNLSSSSDEAAGLRVMQAIMLRTRYYVQANGAGRKTDDIFDYTDYLYNTLIAEQSISKQFVRVLEDAAQHYPEVFAEAWKQSVLSEQLP